MKQLASLVLLISANLPTASCGSSHKNNAPAPVLSGSTIVPFNAALASVSDLPPCNGTNENQLIYVKDSQTFYSCNALAWSIVAIKGERGETGPVGTVEASESGAGLPVVYDANNKMLGWILEISGANADIGSNEINVMLTTGLVTRVSGVNGELSKSTLTALSPGCYHAAPACAGECRTSLSSALTRSVFNSYTVPFYVASTGSNLGVFTYQSYTRSGHDGAGNLYFTCEATGGTLTNSFATRDLQAVSSGALYPYAVPLQIKPN